MKRAIIALALALLPAAPGLRAAQLMLVQGAFSDGSARSASASFVLEQATGFPFGGISSASGFCLAGGFYPISVKVSGVEIGDQSASALPALPKVLTLNRPYPNPGLQPTIRFGLPRATRVSLRVYNVLGQEVANLADGERPAGWHMVRWNGRDRAGRSVAGGVYLLRLQADGAALTNKLMVVH